MHIHTRCGGGVFFFLIAFSVSSWLFPFSSISTVVMEVGSFPFPVLAFGASSDRPGGGKASFDCFSPPVQSQFSFLHSSSSFFHNIPAMAQSSPLESLAALASALPAAGGPINHLPTELLNVILRYVVNDSRYSSVVACMRCCRRWHDCALPLLCEDVILTKSTMDAFVINFPPASCALIQSLEVFGFEVPGLRSRLLRLATKLSAMVTLSSFSFRICRDAFPSKSDKPYLEPCLNTVLDCLPPSCVDLRIDTNGTERVYFEHFHLCDHMRRLVPRLEHFRARLSFLCPTVFFEGSINHPWTWTLVNASSLKTIVINLIIMIEWVIDSTKACLIQNTPEDMGARLPLIKALRELVKRGAFPSVERLWITCIPHPKCPDTSDSEYLAAYHRHDVLEDRTWELNYHEWDDVPLDDEAPLYRSHELEDSDKDSSDDD